MYNLEKCTRMPIRKQNWERAKKDRVDDSKKK